MEEGIAGNLGRISQEMNLLQAGTIFKHTIIDMTETVRKEHLGQTGTAAERIAVEGGNTVRDDHIGQIRAVFKGLPANDGYAIGNDHIGQAGTARKGIFVDITNMVGQIDSRQLLALEERIPIFVISTNIPLRAVPA